MNSSNNRKTHRRSSLPTPSTVSEIIIHFFTHFALLLLSKDLNCFCRRDCRKKGEDRAETGSGRTPWDTSSVVRTGCRRTRSTSCSRCYTDSPFRSSGRLSSDPRPRRRPSSTCVRSCYPRRTPWPWSRGGTRVHVRWWDGSCNRLHGRYTERLPTTEEEGRGKVKCEVTGKDRGQRISVISRYESKSLTSPFFN